jgi:Domain of unknown function (DUF5615)
MKIRFYFDEDAMDGDLIHALRIRGVNVTSALEQGMVRQLDTNHLEFATSQGCVLYSFNIGDFQQLHSEYLIQGKHHSGIVLCQQQRYSLGEQMRRLLNIVGRVSAEEMRDGLLFLSAW